MSDHGTRYAMHGLRHARLATTTLFPHHHKSASTLDCIHSDCILEHTFVLFIVLA